MPVSDIRGHGYDNSANMKVKDKNSGIQRFIFYLNRRELPAVDTRCEQ